MGHEYVCMCVSKGPPTQLESTFTIIAVQPVSAEGYYARNSQFTI